MTKEQELRVMRHLTYQLNVVLIHLNSGERYVTLEQTKIR
jgi:hypothetical protein